MLAASLGFFAPLDRRIEDAFVRLRAAANPPERSPRIVAVDLTDAAEKRLAEGVADRTAFAAFLEIAAEGRLPAAADFLFAGAKDPDGDRELARALAASGAVLPVVPVDPALGEFARPDLEGPEEAALGRALWRLKVEGRGRVPEAASFVLPKTEFLEAARSLGHITLRPDPDGIYRRTPLFFKWRDGYVPALPLALAAAAGIIDPAGATLVLGKELILPRPGREPLRLPVDGEGQCYVPYPGRWSEGNPRYRLDAVLEAAADPDRLDALLSDWDGSMLLLADLTTSRKDFGPTALEEVYPLSGVHSSVLNAVLTGATVSYPGIVQRIVLPLALAALVAALSVMGSRRAFHGGCAAGAVFLIGVSAAAWLGGGRLPWLAGPSIALASAWFSAAARFAYQDDRRKRLLQATLERYFPASVSARVLSEGRSALPPAKKVVSVLFADIAGFTAWSSDKPPELVHSTLSEYLGAMTAILFANGGTVDKFIGDGIMAFFGDPYPQSDHAERAVRAALDMQKKAAELKACWTGEGALPLTIRVGVNSGEALVGNLGSPGRIEYTAIGAAVNLAQRMESKAPPGGVLVTAATRALCGPGLAFAGPDAVEVKGYREPIEAYRAIS